MQLSLNNLRAQVYDGASNMFGKNTGVSEAFIKPWNLNNNDKLKENERCNGNCNMGTDHFVEIIC